MVLIVVVLARCMTLLVDTACGVCLHTDRLRTRTVNGGKTSGHSGHSHPLVMQELAAIAARDLDAILV